ncbi:MAG TPA: hypothetical protein VF013_04485 [Candidatus Limnocylindria bacterium]
MRKLLFALLGTAAAGVAGYKLVIEPWWSRWGVDPDEAARRLPGDDLVPDAQGGDTRGITIAAPPEAVWPWLLQMGYGRGGWYSYDAMDMSGSSATEIRPELQSLAVGELMPVAPRTGFEVKVLEPDRALVLYADTEMMQRQAEAARAGGEADATPANLQATGALMANAQPADFAASWAFVLEPMEGGRTRLIERLRTRFGEGDKPWMKMTLPMMGFGVFVMVRRQLLGIRQRAESSVGRPAISEPEPQPEPAPA